MTYCKPGWKPVTTELRGDKYLDPEYTYQLISRLFDIPVEFIRPSKELAEKMRADRERYGEEA